MKTAFVNMLYLLWQENPNPSKWPGLLSRWAEISQQEANRVLEYGEIQDDILNKVAEANRIEAEVLRYDLMISQGEMVSENVKYLLDKLKHGEGKELAERAQVAPETVSKWKQGDQTPTFRHRAKIKEYLGIEQHVDLGEDPLFLVREPLTDKMRRADLHDHISTADRGTIGKYYDAIKKLLRG